MSIDEKGATSVSNLYDVSRVLLTGAPMGPLSPFSHAHADWAKGHFEHRGRGLRRVPGGATDRRNMPRESAGWIYSPLRLPGPSAGRQKQQFRQQELPPTARLSKFKQLNVFVTCPELPVVTRPAGRRFSSSFLFYFF